MCGCHVRHGYHPETVEGRDSDNHDLPLFGKRPLFLYE